MEKIIVDGGGINWCWYSEYEIERTTEGRATAKQLWSDRFHKWDENQGAGKHPVATHTNNFAASKPVLRVYAREMTEEEKKLEQDSFDFFFKGWVSNCKQVGIDPNGSVKAIVYVTDRTTKETLILTLES